MNKIFLFFRFIIPEIKYILGEIMAQSTVWALGVALIVIGLLTEYANYGGLNWVIGGVVAIIVGWATKNMKM